MLRYLICISLICISLSQAQVGLANYEECNSNGIKHTDIIQTVSKLEDAIKKQQSQNLVELIRLPISLNSKDARFVIQNQTEFLEHYNEIVTPELKKIILAIKPEQVFCNYEGVALNNGAIWLNYDANKLKIIAINMPVNLKKRPSDFGEPVAKINDPKIWAKIINQLPQDQHHYTIKNLDNKYTPYIASDLDTEVTLYKADLNNNGYADYVFVHVCEGSMCSGGIDAVFEAKDNKLKRLDFAKAVINSFRISDLSKWYLLISKPFITRKHDTYYMHFYNHTSSQVCTYIWKDTALKRVGGNKKFCVSN
jgi:hypothetical protein